MKKIVILSHMPGRDSGFDQMLAAELRKRGYAVWLRTFLQNDKLAIATIKPDILCVPEIRNEYVKDLCSLYRKYGGTVVVKMCEFTISEESIPFISEEYKNAIFGNLNVNQSCDLVLAWGKKSVSLMREYSSISGEKIVSCGGIAFDQYFTKRPDITRSPKKTILFATGFPYADRNPQYSVPEAKEGENIHREFVEMDTVNRSRWITMLREFVAQEEFKDWLIYIKPHAGEKQEIYEAVVPGIEDRVIHLSPAQQAFITLEYCDVVVHAGSTMAYEAHMRDIPAFNFINNCQDRIISEISPNFADSGKLFEAIKGTEIGKSNANPDIVRVVEENYYGPVDGCAYVRAADEIERLKTKNVSIPDVWKQEYKFKTNDSALFQSCMQWKCEGCGNFYFLTENREMVKCPYCGIANVKIMTKTT